MQKVEVVEQAKAALFALQHQLDTSQCRAPTNYVCQSVYSAAHQQLGFSMLT